MASFTALTWFLILVPMPLVAMVVAWEFLGQVCSRQRSSLDKKK